MHATQLDRQSGNGAPREARPLEDNGLAVRLAPFIGLAAVSVAVVPFAYSGLTSQVVFAGLLVALIAVASLLVPWSRLPASWQAGPPLLLYGVAALLRDATGGGDSLFTALILLPVVWLALYGTLGQVLLSVAGCFLTIGLPALVGPGGKYPSSEYGRAALDSVMTGALGATGVHLMRRIREREELSRSILDSAREAFVSIDERGRIVEWNSQAESDFGWSRGEALGSSFAETIFPAGDLEHYQPGLQRMLAGDRRILGRRLQITARRRDGMPFPIELSFSALRTAHGIRFNAFLRDISERRRSEEALHQANQRFRSAFDDAPIGMAIVNPEGRLTRVNRALIELLGYSEEELIGMTFAEITHPDDQREGLDALQEMVEGLRDSLQVEKRFLHAEGHQIWASLSTSIVRDSRGKSQYLISHIQDISERKQTEARLAHRATHDDLTGLPKRAVLEDRMVLALNRQRRERKPIAILYLDLDGFKRINDTQGHDAGDFVLVAVAKRLTALVRPTDVVSRLGGDEFAILCEAMNEHGATRLAKRIVEVVPKQIDFGPRSLTVTPSVGIALGRDPALQPGELLAHADTAMYFAKRQDVSSYAFYEDELRQRARMGFGAGLGA